MATSIATFFLGSGVVGIISIIIAWRKFPLEKKSAKLDHSKVTVDIALSTLEAVNTQYQEVLSRQSDLEKEVNNLKGLFDEQKTLVSKLKDYILHILNNWETIRHNPEPPTLTMDIQTHIFKDDKE